VYIHYVLNALIVLCILVFFSMPMYFYVVFFSFVFLLLLIDFNMFDAIAYIVAC